MSNTLVYYFIVLGSLCGLLALSVCYVLSKTMAIMQDKAYLGTFKIHTTDTPRCGGIGIFISLIVVIIAGLEIPYVSVDSVRNTPQVAIDTLAGLHFYLACFIVCASGILRDNNHDISIILIVLIQIVGICYCIVSFNFLLPYTFSFSLIINTLCGAICIFFATNSMNIIDGIHGNTAFISLIIIASLTYIAYCLHINFIVFVCSILLGIMLIFLCFNFPYGKMFLGDSGAFLLGFILSTLLFIGVKYYNISVLYAIGLFVYPLCEMVASILVRLKYIQFYSFNEVFLHLCEPSNYHLHFFLYIRFKHYASVLLSGIYAIFIFFLTLYYTNDVILFIISVGFCMLYVILFFTFRTKQQYLYK